MDRDIKFGFWNYVESGVYGADAVDQWKDLHCNLPMSFTYDCKRHKKQDMIDVLDKCSLHGMKLIVCDSRTHYKTLVRLGKEAFTEGVKEAYNDFGHHPAVFGFFVGDEPAMTEYEAYIDAINIVVEIAKGLIPFANLVPYWGGGSDFDMLVGAKEKKHDQIVENLLSKANLPLLGYDQYCQCLTEQANQQCGINSYFFVLDKYNQITKKYGIPFYVSLLACGHWDYRVPTEDDIRWQIYTSIAHGARGIIWFHLYQYEAGTSYVNTPIIGPDRLTSPTYDAIKRQQYIFDSYYREILDKIYMTDVYHVGHIYDPRRRFGEDEYILDINGKYSHPTILTYYKEYESDERWVSLVNADQRLSNKITLKMKSGKEHVVWLAPGEMWIKKLANLI